MSLPQTSLTIEFQINSKTCTRTNVDARRTLADFLREDAGLTGTHLGCEHGACGACTVLIDGAPARACLTLAAQANGTQITTVEGLASASGVLHPLQRAFKANHALQCGFCTPGFLVAAAALLQEIPDPTELEVREYLSGNICRCTGYQFIVAAVMAAAAEINGKTEPGETNV